FDVLRTEPTDADETAAIADDLLRAKWNMVASPATLRETIELAHDFAPSAAPPANVVRLVETAAADVATREARNELNVGDVLAALSHRSSLPISLLDPATPLDPEAVRDFLEKRVLGQREAVDKIVNRIAMIKARVTD